MPTKVELLQQIEKLEEALSKLQAENRKLKHCLGHRNQFKISSDRPIRILASEIPIVAKLNVLKSEVRYPRMDPGRSGNKMNPVEWVRQNLGGTEPQRLTSDEIEIVLAKPTLLKALSSRLYLTLLKRNEVAHRNRNI